MDAVVEEVQNIRIVLKLAGKPNWRFIFATIESRLIDTLGNDDTHGHAVPDFSRSDQRAVLVNGILVRRGAQIETRHPDSSRYAAFSCALIAPSEDGDLFIDLFTGVGIHPNDEIAGEAWHLAVDITTVGNVDPMRCIDIIKDHLARYRVTYTHESANIPYLSAQDMLTFQNRACVEHARSLQAALNKTSQALETANSRLREETEKNKATAKSHARTLKDLETAVDTHRATAERHRDRADAAERQLRALVTGAQPMASPFESSGDIQNSGLSERNAQLENLLDQAEMSLLESTEEIDRLRVEVRRLREESALLRIKPEDEVVPSSARTYPDHLNNLDDWARDNLSGRLVVLPKAAKAARKSSFADHALVYRTLQALVDLYWPMRFEKDMAKKALWSQFLAENGLSNGPIGMALKNHQTSDAYHVHWQRSRVPLDRHIQGSDSRNETLCFRLYYHVDVDEKLIVVGHVPTHLPNTLS